MRVSDGVPHACEWMGEFVGPPEYEELCELGERFRGLVVAGATVTRGQHNTEVDTFTDALDWLMKEAKRGLHIQRYKGLGEMNPDQLWETTMDPDTRRLMQVRIEDVVASDEIFTTLMGDHVEPRREFIEHNALLVGNLDV